VLAALLLTGAAAGLAACSGSGDIAVLDTTIVTWPGADGATAGQVIVSVRNDADEPVDPDVLGNDRLTLAQLRGPGGAELTEGDARVQLHAVPHVLGPGEAGYLIGDFEITQPSERLIDARVEINARPADARKEVSVEGFQLVELADGLGGAGRLEWDGLGSAVARVIAIGADGRPVGYLATSQVLYDPGEFTVCCFPPDLELASIDHVVAFGDQAIGDE
jgi:hypothetical protein